MKLSTDKLEKSKVECQKKKPNRNSASPMLNKIVVLRNCAKHTEKRHTGIPGLWTKELDAGLWTLDPGS